MPSVAREAGAVAGLAGLVGVTMLWSLHWSQARDVRRLRVWAGGAPGRAWIGARAIAAAVVGLLVLVGAAAALTGGGDDHAETARAKAHGKVFKKPRRAAPAVKPADVTVAVLNATTVTGLAAGLRDRLVAVGFAKGPIDVSSDQGLATSVVQYAPGRQAAARAVGRALGIDRRAPVTADSRARAGDATVVVIAGADQTP